MVKNECKADGLYSNRTIMSRMRSQTGPLGKYPMCSQRPHTIPSQAGHDPGDENGQRRLTYRRSVLTVFMVVKDCAETDLPIMPYRLASATLPVACQQATAGRANALPPRGSALRMLLSTRPAMLSQLSDFLEVTAKT